MLEANSTLPQPPTNEPQKPKGRLLFTKETAKANAAKAHAVMKSQKFSGTLAATRDAEYYAFKRHLTGQTQVMLDRTIGHYCGQKTFNGRAVIAGTFEKLFRIWCHLTGTPAPGNLRPQDLVKRVEKLGLKSFAQQVMIDAPSPVEDPVAKLATELAAMPMPEDELGEEPQPTSEKTTNEPTADESLTDDAHNEEVFDSKESLISPQAEPVPTPDPTHPTDGD